MRDSPPVASDTTVLTVREVAAELRCSKAHVHNIITGKVPGLPPLPILRIGRRVLVRRDGLQSWMLLLEAHEIEIKRGRAFSDTLSDAMIRADRYASLRSARKD